MLDYYKKHFWREIGWFFSFNALLAVLTFWFSVWGLWYVLPESLQSSPATHLFYTWEELILFFVCFALAFLFVSMVRVYVGNRFYQETSKEAIKCSLVYLWWLWLLLVLGAGWAVFAFIGHVTLLTS